MRYEQEFQVPAPTFKLYIVYQADSDVIQADEVIPEVDLDWIIKTPRGGWSNVSHLQDIIIKTGSLPGC